MPNRGYFHQTQILAFSHLTVYYYRYTTSDLLSKFLPTCWHQVGSKKRSVDPYPGLESGYGSRRANDPQNWKKFRNFIFWSAWCSLLRAEGFFCSLDVFYGGLDMGILHFLIKILNFFLNCYNFWSSKPLIRIVSGSVFSLKGLIRIKWMRIQNTGFRYLTAFLTKVIVNQTYVNKKTENLFYQRL